MMPVIKPNQICLSGEDKHDGEGRVITAEFDDYYFVTACMYINYLLNVFMANEV